MFTCKHGNKVIWETKVQGFTIEYVESISIPVEDKKAWTSLGKNVHTYQFTLPETLADGSEIICVFDRVGGTPSVYGNTDSVVTVEGKTVSVNIGIFKQSGETTIEPEFGDEVDFNLRFVCLDKLDNVLWTQTITGFALQYTAEEVCFPNDCFVVNEVENGYGTISSIDWDKVPQLEEGVVYNTLTIPVMIDDTQIIEVTENFWANSSANGHDEDMGNIKTLRIAYDENLDACCPKYGSRAFSGAKINAIDFSQIPGDIVNIGYGLEIFPESSELAHDGAFSDLVSLTGNMIWNPELSLYKRSIVKSAMYAGGLKSINWYNLTFVTERSGLEEALHSGATVVLDKDIDVSVNDPELEFAGQIDVKESSVLDLNGHSIYASKPVFNKDSAQMALITVWNSAELVIADSSADEKHPDGQGSIKTFDCTSEKAKEEGWTEKSTEAIDVRSALPLREQALLEITGGNYYGNETCIEARNCPVYIEGGTYHIFRTNFQDEAHDQLTYDRILNCVDTETEQHPIGVPYFANFYVYGGKFYGEYRKGSYDKYEEYRKKPEVDYKFEYYKNYWNVHESETAIPWPIGEKPYQIDDKGVVNPEFSESGTVERDECFCNPFWTYSEPNRIYDAKHEETKDLPFWWSWIPAYDLEHYKFYLTYHPHNGDNPENYTEVNFEVIR